MDNQNNSNKKTIVSIVVLLILIIALTLFWQFHGFQFGRQSAQVINSQQQTENQPEAEIITALHQFSKGKHTVAGEVTLPTPCHILNQDVSINSGVTPEQINIAFVTTTKDETLCAQVLTSTRYKIDFVAAENAVITATWNGAPAQLNLVPVAPGESLENFDVFIKG